MAGYILSPFIERQNTTGQRGVVKLTFEQPLKELHQISTRSAPDLNIFVVRYNEETAAYEREGKPSRSHID
jgi:hypothetical protein